MEFKNNLVIRILLSMLFFMPSISFARDYRDSILMNRIWAYNQKIRQNNPNIDENAYLVYTLDLKRRNFLLWLVPTMYSVAKGDRKFIGEEYGKVVHSNKYDFHFERQAMFSTIPHQRKPIPAMFDLQSPNLHGEQIYRDRLLSPFWKTNHRYYKYKMLYLKDNKTLVIFKPRVSNTQLIIGVAIVNFSTGAIESINFNGEFDMLKFSVNTEMDKNSIYGLPTTSNTLASFNFLGNKILTSFTSYYGLKHTLPDSLHNKYDYNTMVSVRPRPLTSYQDSIYLHHYQQVKAREEAMKDNKKDSISDTDTDSVSTFYENFNKVKDFLWDDVGDYMVNSNGYQTEKTTMRISPLLNPLYMSYSSSKGISYKLSMTFSYNWNAHRFITLEPRLGYTFKLKQLYYTIPLVFTYNPKRRGNVGFIWSNGNRTSSATLAEKFREKVGNKIEFPVFRDEYFRLYNHIDIFNWVSMTTGLNFHLRKANSKRELLDKLGFPVAYRSFAPYLSIHLNPWQERGPMLTANYERSIKDVARSNLRYERWEFDASFKHNVKRMQILNLRAGAGFYTHRSTDFFVDYTNFCDNNLPTGWDDDWSGQFHLIDTRWYNESNYYIRGHVSYDSPLLALSWIPLVGRYLETERLYLSVLNIERTRLYSEVGYGLKCRYFSAAVFASFLNVNYKSIGIKFDVQLFRRW